MGGTVSALIENTFGALKSQEEISIRRRPGWLRLGLRKLRGHIVTGKGAVLLPPEIPDDEYDSNCLRKKEVERKDLPIERNDSRSFAAFVVPVGKKKKKVRHVFHKQEGARSGDKLARMPSYSLRSKKSFGAGIAAFSHKRMSMVKSEEEIRAQRLARQRREKLLVEHQRRIQEAKGCRGLYDEICMAVLMLLYTLIMIWSAVRLNRLNHEKKEEYYDSANGVFYVMQCNVDEYQLRLWWRMNIVWTASLFVLVAAIESFYWFLAPYSPAAGLSTFSRNLARNVVFVAWLILITIWTVAGASWFFEADADACGHRNVDQARGLLIAQFCWLGFHALVFTSNFNNRMAVKRRWCLDSTFNTALLRHGRGAADGQGGETDGEDSDYEMHSVGDHYRSTHSIHSSAKMVDSEGDDEEGLELEEEEEEEDDEDDEGDEGEAIRALADTNRPLVDSGTLRVARGQTHTSE
ncbi:hypothetical protein DIPPA_32731 [Diplonema papillatum]|nr:hypothetical protein DIPPA_32731 [Diplonema papillatum]